MAICCCRVCQLSFADLVFVDAAKLQHWLCRKLETYHNVHEDDIPEYCLALIKFGKVLKWKKSLEADDGWRMNLYRDFVPQSAVERENIDLFNPFQLNYDFPMDIFIWDIDHLDYELDPDDDFAMLKRLEKQAKLLRQWIVVLEERQCLECLEVI